MTISTLSSATVRCGGRGCVCTKARSTLALQSGTADGHLRVIETPLGLEIIARWGNLPISMFLRTEGSLKLEMLRLARTSKYVDNTSVLSINKTEEDS